MTEQKESDILHVEIPSKQLGIKRKVIKLKLSTKGRYGLRAMIDMARYSTKEPVSISSVAARQGISEGYLEQIVSLLKKADLVKSIRGAGGGYILARDMKDISVGDVLRALEGQIELVRCAAYYSEEGCTAADGCVTKYVWKRINESISRMVDEMKLDELVRESKKLNPKGDSDNHKCNQ